MSEAFMPSGAGSIEILWICPEITSRFPFTLNKVEGCCHRTSTGSVRTEFRFHKCGSYFGTTPKGRKCGQQSSSLKGDGYKRQLSF